MVDVSSRQPPDLGRLKLDLHRQMVDLVDFSRAETLSEEDLRRQLRSLADYLCNRHAAEIPSSQRETLITELMDEIYGFAPIESLMVDPDVTDILINGCNRILVEKNGLLSETDLRFTDDGHLLQFIHRLVGRAGRRIDEANPMVDARLPDGSRCQCGDSTTGGSWSDGFDSSFWKQTTGD